MDNYFKNQIRRANCAWTKKVGLYLMGLLRPATLGRQWRKHVAQFQNELNRNNWDRRGFYMSGDQLCLAPIPERDWTIFTAKGSTHHSRGI